jgi:hypothetical protein
MEYEKKRPPTREEREAKRDKAQLAAQANMAENRKLENAFRKNYERLKAERLERERQAREIKDSGKIPSSSPA